MLRGRSGAGRGGGEHVVDDPAQVRPGEVRVEPAAERLQAQRSELVDQADGLVGGDDPVRAVGGAQLLDRLGAVERHRLRRERSEEHTSELQSLMRISYAVFCLKKKQK